MGMTGSRGDALTSAGDPLVPPGAGMMMQNVAEAVGDTTTIRADVGVGFGLNRQVLLLQVTSPLVAGDERGSVVAVYVY
jgi:hypothetical protein